MKINKPETLSISDIKSRLRERMSYHASETDVEICALLGMMDDKLFPVGMLKDLSDLVNLVKWVDFQRSLFDNCAKVRTIIQAERNKATRESNLKIVALSDLWKRYEAMPTPELEKLNTHRDQIDSYDAEVICRILRKRLGVVSTREN